MSGGSSSTFTSQHSFSKEPRDSLFIRSDQFQRDKGATNSIQTNLGEGELPNALEYDTSPSNGDKKPGRFKRMMNWVDRTICGGSG